jgi:hypothetical protein
VWWRYRIATGQANAIHPQGDAKANNAKAVQIAASQTACARGRSRQRPDRQLSPAFAGFDANLRNCRSAVVSAPKATAQNALAAISRDESEGSGLRDAIRAGSEKNSEKVRSWK